MALLGATTLQLALVSCGLTLLLSLWHLRTPDLRVYVSAQRGMLISSGLVLLATSTLVQQLMVSNFALEYGKAGVALAQCY